MTPQTVPCAAAVLVTAAGVLTHRCPFADETDHGHITVRWTTAGATIELHSLAAWLGGFADTVISHEAVTDHIRDELSWLLGITDVAVETRWDTAQLAVTVRGGDGRAVLRQPIDTEGA